MGTFRRTWLVVASTIAVAGGLVSPVLDARPAAASDRITLPSWKPLQAQWQKGGTEPALDAKQVFDKVGSAVWTVYTVPSEHFIERLRKPRRMSQGSAVAISEHLLVTNCHVVRKARGLTVAYERKTRFEAVVAAADGLRDLCVLHTDTTLPSYVTTFRRFDDLAPGEQVFAIGSPEGYDRSISGGLVSGKRTIHGPRRGMSRLIQTSAPTSEGSSGGGLFDTAGNLVGVTSFIDANRGQLSFAIAIEDYTIERPPAR